MNTPLIKALTTSASLTQEELATQYVEKALANDVLLSRMGSEQANSSDFNKPVLKTYVSVEDGTEGVAPTPSIDPVFVSQKAVFHKNESLVSVTDEIINQANTDIVANVFGQIAAQTAVKVQSDLLNDNVDFGLVNLCIDKENQFATGAIYGEAIKADDVRNDYVFQALKSGISGEWGSDGNSKIEFLIDLIATVPSRYLMADDFAIYMSRTTWFTEFEALFDTTGGLVNRSISPFTFQGHPVVLLDGLATDVIFCGSLTAGYELVQLNSSYTFVEDEQTLKGQSQYFVSNRFAGLPLDNTAIRVGVQAV